MLKGQKATTAVTVDDIIASIGDVVALLDAKVEQDQNELKAKGKSEMVVASANQPWSTYRAKAINLAEEVKTAKRMSGLR